jgi:hypothetical protein
MQRAGHPHWILATTHQLQAVIPILSQAALNKELKPLAPERFIGGTLKLNWYTFKL